MFDFDLHLNKTSGGGSLCWTVLKIIGKINILTKIPHMNPSLHVD